MSNQNSNSPRHPANNKMLIDATHPEETRVVVLRNGRVEEFDYESAARKLLRGNIYLAKVTRVEPSLQAAFVDYGGNRHGFLAFNEIHPDYYQIPVADRRALIEAESQAEAEEEEAADRAAEAAARRSRNRDNRDNRNGRRNEADEDNAVDVTALLPPEHAEGERHETESETAPSSHDEADAPREVPERAERDAVVHGEVPESSSEPVSVAAEEQAPENVETAAERSEGETETHHEHHHHHEEDGHHAHAGDEAHAEAHGDTSDDAGESAGGEGRVETVETGNGADAEQIETVSASEDVLEEVPVRPRRRLRSYKIQEVTKRRQVLLVQVVKEERGTKGAALTTYLSLAGRYTVLMPNTARGGGISRKINNPQDRKRLKAIAAELDVPEGMGLIIRTAGAARTKQEIKRDYEYLLRLWESVRELALSSNAPALVYEEGNLIKRSIRDLYGKEVEEIVVAGDEAFREARDFMRMLMPSHAKNVLSYEEPEPLFTRFGMERQLNAMFSPYVHLRSGGYLVINQTEALVAIDINSGKSTREFSIEETALSTNLEAADEIARQLKLRDLAGLIVIDFIDMEEKRNNRAVERRLKEALKYDRARIQLGRISHFGLLEMSRQRMRTGVLEGSTTQCPHCQGTGIIRSTESVALAVLRGLEDALINGTPASLVATTTSTVALYILNNKRPFITEMENRYSITIQIQASDKVQGANFTVERQARRDEAPRRSERPAAVNMDWGFDEEDQDAEAGEAVSSGEESAHDHDHEHAAGEPAGQGEGRRRRRRRRGRRGDREPGADERHQSAEGDDRSSPSHDAGAGDEAPDDVGGDFESAEEAGGYGQREPGNGHEIETIGEDGEGDDEDETTQRQEGDGQGERRRRRRRGRRGGRRNHERQGASEGGEAADANARPEEGDAREETHAQVNGGADHLPEHFGERVSFTEVQGEVADVSLAVSARAVSMQAEKVHAAAADVSQREASRSAILEEPAAPVATEAVTLEPVADEAPPAPAPSPRRAPVASEPVLERVVVGPDAVGAAASGEETPRPARRGWWQRR